jgi:hypothetical protein
VLDALTWHVLLELLPSTELPLAVKVVPVSEMLGHVTEPLKTGLLRFAF